MKEKGSRDDARLSVKDFETPLFDRQRPVVRTVHTDENGCQIAKPRKVIEGVTITDSYNKFGYTYDLTSGVVAIINMDNKRLYLGKVTSSEEFEKALKKADRKQRTL